jgi:hypothetical protein
MDRRGVGRTGNGSVTVERGLCAGTRVDRANLNSPASKTADGAVLQVRTAPRTRQTPLTSRQSVNQIDG